ncbi:AfaD family invasin [Aeromonas veronii]
MKLKRFVNNQRLEAAHWLSLLLLCLLLCPTYSIASDATVQLSMVPLEGTRLKDGYLIGQGRVVCTGEHSGFRVWMAPDFLTQDNRSYVLNQANNPQAKMHIRLQGNGWHPAMSSEQGIVKAGGESSAVFDIVANGEQLLSSGNYELQVSVACI